MIEITPKEFWIPKNLVCCLLECLKLIYRLAKAAYCPNYFICKENIFDGKVDNYLSQKLSTAIIKIYSNIESSLQQIQCQSLGELLKSPLPFLNPVSFEYGKHSTIPACIAQFSSERNKMIAMASSIKTEEFVQNLCWKAMQLEGDMMMKGYTQDEIKEVSNIGLPYIQPTLLSTMVALKLQQNESEKEIKQFLQTEKFHETFVHFDSLKLKTANIMHMLGYVQESKSELESLKKQTRISICGCKKKNKLQMVNMVEQITKLSIELGTCDIKITDSKEYVTIDVDCQQAFVSSCVVFVPTEKQITPTVIQYDMIRTFGGSHSPIGKNTELKETNKVKNEETDFVAMITAASEDDFSDSIFEIRCKRNMRPKNKTLEMKVPKTSTTRQNTAHMLISGYDSSEEEFVSEWSFVDGIFLQYFLLYLNDTELGNKADAHEEEMQRMVNTDNISHKATCLNILGWIYRTNGCLDKAVSCFEKSLKTEHTHNAAYWHLCFVFLDVFQKRLI